MFEQEQSIFPALKKAIKVLTTILKSALILTVVHHPQAIKTVNVAVRTTKAIKSQKGHNGSRLQKTDEPDEIININHDLRKLPSGKYNNVGYEA